jgi:adenosylhomocysteine nucleosidase
MSRASAPWLIAAAVEQEIEGIREAVGGQREPAGTNASVWSGNWKENPLLLVRTGVGPSQVRESLGPFLSDRPVKGILSIGYAGGLQEAYKFGDVHIPDEVQSLPPLPEGRFRPDPELRGALLQAASSGPWRVHRGRMLTVDRVIFSSDEKRRLGSAYDAGSVEMESAVVAELAQSESVPFAVVRVVLDEASFSLPDMLTVFRWWRRKQFAKLVSYVVAHPSKLLELLKLHRRSRRASRDLTHLFRGFLLDGMFRDGQEEDDKGVVHGSHRIAGTED